MLFTVHSKAPWLQLLSLNCMRMRIYNGVGDTQQMLAWHGSCRHDRIIKMVGDVLALLEPRYYRTLETGMTVIESFVKREARLPQLLARAARGLGTLRLALRRANSISMTTMFAHTALLLCARLYC